MTTLIQQMHLLISGHVQGVSYRYNSLEKAIALGVVGWVRNLPDGRVELLAEGKIEPLRALLEWAYQGPKFAKVIDITIEYTPPSGAFSDFEIR